MPDATTNRGLMEGMHQSYSHGAAASDACGPSGKGPLGIDGQQQQHPNNNNNNNTRHQENRLLHLIYYARWDAVRAWIRENPETIASPCHCGLVTYSSRQWAPTTHYSNGMSFEDDEDDTFYYDSPYSSSSAMSQHMTSTKQHLSAIHLLVSEVAERNVLEDYFPVDVLEQMLLAETAVWRASNKSRPHAASIRKDVNLHGYDEGEEEYTHPVDIFVTTYAEIAEDDDFVLDVLRVFTRCLPAECWEPRPGHNLLSNAIRELQDFVLDRSKVREACEILLDVQPKWVSHADDGFSDEPQPQMLPLAEYGLYVGAIEQLEHFLMLDCLLPKDSHGGNLVHRMASFRETKSDVDTLFRVLCNLPNMKEAFMVQDDNGNTPLHRAAAHSHHLWGWVKCDGGRCSARMKNKDGQLPFDLLIQRWQRENNTQEEQDRLDPNEWSFLLQVYPAAVERLELDDRLFPRIIKQMAHRPVEMGGLFNLLRQRPSLMSHHAGSVNAREERTDAVGMYNRNNDMAIEVLADDELVPHDCNDVEPMDLE